jgi:hypothetical protein
MRRSCVEIYEICDVDLGFEDQLESIFGEKPRAQQRNLFHTHAFQYVRMWGRCGGSTVVSAVATKSIP